MQNMMYTSVGDKFITPLQIPGDYHPNMDHLELIEAQITREGMLAYESITEASLAGYQEMILFKRRIISMHYIRDTVLLSWQRNRE